MYGGTPLKLQINSVEALERLIGGDAEVEFEIRNSVVQEFTKKHLKALAEQMLYQPALNTMKAEMEQFISTRFGTFANAGYASKFILNDRIQAQIKSEVSGIVAGICRRELIAKSNELRESMNLDTFKFEVMDYVRRHIKDQIVNETINGVVDKLKHL